MTRSSAALLGVVACVIGAGRAWGQDAFDWRDYNGHNWLTPVRNQGSCGSCWAFGALAAVEAKLKITANAPSWNPDLSEQHLICDPSGGGDCEGGWHSSALWFVRYEGVVDESELPYQGQDPPVSGWPLAAGWENRSYAIDSYMWVGDFDGDGTYHEPEDYQGALRAHGPLAIAIDHNDLLWSRPMSTAAPEQRPVPADAGLGGDDPDGPLTGIDHCVCIVGYQDDSRLQGGGYWIIKNSWGSGRADGGYFYLYYGDESSVYAVNGDAYYVPEPAALSLLGIGGLMLLRRWRGRR